MSAPDPETRLTQVLHQVGDVQGAIDFYSAAFGWGVRFADGDRYAAIDAGAGVVLALAGPKEEVTGGPSAVCVRVSEVGAAVQNFIDAGGLVVRAVERGGHETRAVVLDPWNKMVVIYGPR